MSKRRHPPRSREDAYEPEEDAPLPPILEPPARVCPAIGCANELGVSMLFCNDHWSKVPPEIKGGILDHYIAGQAPFGSGKPKPEWIESVREAIQFLKKEDGVR